MSHRYYLTLRPASIGCYPDRNNAGERIEATIVEEHWPPKRLDANRNHYATVEYAEPLEFERIWRYDLLPADPVERAHYALWDFYGRNANDAAVGLNSFRNTPRAKLESYRDRGDMMAAYALTILDAQAA